MSSELRLACISGEHCDEQEGYGSVFVDKLDAGCPKSEFGKLLFEHEHEVITDELIERVWIWAQALTKHDDAYIMTITDWMKAHHGSRINFIAF